MCALCTQSIQGERRFLLLGSSSPRNITWLSINRTHLNTHACIVNIVLSDAQWLRSPTYYYNMSVEKCVRLNAIGLCAQFDALSPLGISSFPCVTYFVPGFYLKLMLGKTDPRQDATQHWTAGRAFSRRWCLCWQLDVFRINAGVSGTHGKLQRHPQQSGNV